MKQKEYTLKMLDGLKQAIDSATKDIINAWIDSIDKLSDDIDMREKRVACEEESEDTIDDTGIASSSNTTSEENKEVLEEGAIDIVARKLSDSFIEASNTLLGIGLETKASEESIDELDSFAKYMSDAMQMYPRIWPLKKNKIVHQSFHDATRGTAVFVTIVSPRKDSPTN